MPTPLEHLGDARAIARKKVPYLRKPVLSLIPKAREGLGTVACTDRYVLLYDPAAILEWSPTELATALAHEVSHILREHHKRIKRFPNPRKGNLAGDLAINPDLRAMGLSLPPGVAFPEQFGLPAGLALEEYYERLPDDDDGGGGEGSEGQDTEGEGWGTEGQPGKKGRFGAGHCGSCAGNPVENEPEGEGVGRTDAEIERIKRETGQAVKDYIARKGQGSVPGSWGVWADAVLGQEKLPWQAILAKKVKRAIAFRPGSNAWSYSWHNRRQASVGYGPGKPILPGCKAKVPHVAVVIDTSGSMGPKDIQDAVNETFGILKSVGADVEFVACDAGVQAVAKINAASAKTLTKHMRGGGGTDFRPIFAEFEKRPERRRPEVLIYLTDGGGYAPDREPPGMRVVWTLIGKHRCTPLLASGGNVTWGEILEVD